MSFDVFYVLKLCVITKCSFHWREKKLEMFILKKIDTFFFLNVIQI